MSLNSQLFKDMSKQITFIQKMPRTLSDWEPDLIQEKDSGQSWKNPDKIFFWVE